MYFNFFRGGPFAIVMLRPASFAQDGGKKKKRR